jgi:hypothetical protein
MKCEHERDVVRACLDYLRLRGVFAFRVNNTGIWDSARKAFRSFRGLRGVSDILGVLPRTLDVGGRCVTVGVFLAVEVKSARGRLTPEQAAFADAVRRAGGVSLVVHSLKELMDALDVEGVAKKENVR